MSKEHDGRSPYPSHGGLQRPPPVPLFVNPGPALPHSTQQRRIWVVGLRLASGNSRKGLATHPRPTFLAIEMRRSVLALC